MWPTIMMLGKRPLITWTVFALIGAWVAYFSLRASLARARIPSIQVTIFFLGATAAWFLGAYGVHGLTVGRPYYVFLHKFQFAGYVLYGGVAATIAYGAAAWFALGWHKRMRVQELWDEGALALAWALFFGRIGCTLYGCCYGSPSGSWPGYLLSTEHWDYPNRSFPETLRGVHLHYATVYEALGLLAIIGCLYWARRVETRRPGTFPPGVTGWICWIGYGVVRFLCEFVRGDPRGASHLGLTFSQWSAVVTVSLGAALIQWDWRMKRSRLL